MTLFPATIPFQHQVFETLGTADSHGNDVGVLGEPIDRLAIGWYQTGSTEPISVDYISRTVSDINVMVEDPTLFNTRDMLLISGQAFEVIGVPADWAHGPWGSGLFGGEVHCRRVD